MVDMFAATDMAKEIAALQKAGKLPRELSPRQTALLQKALAKYSGQVSQKVLSTILDDFKSKIESANSAADPVQQRDALYDLTKLVESPEMADEIRFSLKISREVASGAGLYLNQNLSPEAVEEYPALEFLRMFDRTVPRGFKAGPKGTLIPVPDDAWDTSDGRWVKACEEAGDEDALRVFRETGRMVALKASGVWQALGNGAGGYDDTLGNPFPPFAFNSGYRTVDLHRKEAIELGLMDEEDEAEPAKIDFAQLFAEVE